jgi:hypothetical protein
MGIDLVSILVDHHRREAGLARLLELELLPVILP